MNRHIIKLFCSLRVDEGGADDFIEDIRLSDSVVNISSKRFQNNGDVGGSWNIQGNVTILQSNVRVQVTVKKQKD